MNRQAKIFLIILITFSLFLSACRVENQATKVGELGNEVQDGEETGPQAPQEIIYEVGDIVSVNDTILVVLGWDQPPGGDFNPPDEGKKYLVVDVVIGNQGQKSFTSSPVFQMTLKDPSGQKYNINGKANIASGSNQPNGEVNPGEIIRGKVGFHVPEDLTNFTFVYEANLLGIGEVSVNLGPTPLTMEPPEDLNLVQQQEVFQIGDLVLISDLTIQVLNVSFPAGTDFIKPKEGYQFVSVDIQIDNQGENVQEINSIAQMYLKDSTGQKYTFHLGAQSVVDTGLPDDELQPGERVRGQISFQVPLDISGMVLVFDADIFGFGKAFIALQ
jgi:hypothetical protein